MPVGGTEPVLDAGGQWAAALRDREAKGPRGRGAEMWRGCSQDSAGSQDSASSQDSVYVGTYLC